LDYYYNQLKFKNENELYKFTNHIKFKLTNNSNKKYLFYLNSLKLNDIYNIEVIIKDKKKNLIIKREPIIDGIYNCKKGSLLEHHFYNINASEKLLTKMGYNPIRNSIFLYFNQGVVINPDESYVFDTTISLPFVIENNDENLGNPVYFRLNPSEKYTFKLKYKLKENIDSILPKEMLKNLEDNNIEIFKEKIETQEIPIIFKK